MVTNRPGGAYWPTRENMQDMCLYEFGPWTKTVNHCRKKRQDDVCLNNQDPTNILSKTLLDNICFFLLSVVVFNVFFMLSVSLSAYIIAFPLIFLAALPTVCINDLLLLRKPSLSASNIITNETSGRSNPSRRRLPQPIHQMHQFLVHLEFPLFQ